MSNTQLGIRILFGLLLLFNIWLDYSIGFNAGVMSCNKNTGGVGSVGGSIAADSSDDVDSVVVEEYYK